MNKTGYKLLGYVTYKSGKWYMHYRLRHLSNATKFAAGGAVALLVGAIGLLVATKHCSSGESE